MQAQLATALAQAAQESDPKTKLQAYQGSLLECLRAPAGDARTTLLKALVDHITSDFVPLVVSRQVVADLVVALAQPQAVASGGGSPLSSGEVKAVGHFVHGKLSPRQVSFEEQISKLLIHLADVYEAEEDWSEAAKCLIAIPFNDQRPTQVEWKLNVFIRIAMLSLECDDLTKAKVYCDRVAGSIHQTADLSLILKFKGTFARILDMERKYHEAATKYHELSYAAPDDEDKSMALRQAVVCAVLSPSGPRRNRLLATLYKDERTWKLEERDFLEKMYLDRILKPADVESFKASCREHHLAKFGDGTTGVSRACTEHNLFAASKLYENISVVSLGGLLGIYPDMAEKIAAKAVAEGRLVAYLEQETRTVHFSAMTQGKPLVKQEKTSTAPGGLAGGLGLESSASGVAPGPLARFDESVKGLCRQVDEVLELALGSSGV